MLKILSTFFTQQATLIRRSTVLSLAPKLVFLAKNCLSHSTFF
jgi:hypothetical protein